MKFVKLFVFLQILSFCYLHFDIYRKLKENNYYYKLIESNRCTRIISGTPIKLINPRIITPRM